MNKLAFAASLLSLAAGTSALAETLILSTANPPGHYAVQNGLQPFMTCVQDKAVGIDFNFFPSGQIADNNGALDALNNGLAQIAFVSATSLSDKLPLANISVLPNMGENSTQMNQAWRKVLTEGGPMADEIKANRMHVLYVHMFPPYQLGLSSGKIEGIGDFAGMKMRVAGGSQVFSVTALEGVPVQISAGDAYVAMQNGTIDGYMLAATSVESYKLQEVTKTLTDNTNFAGALAFIAIDQDYYGGLSADKQAALDDCGGQIEVSLVAHQDSYIAELNAKFKEAGVDVYSVSDATLAELNARLDLAVADYIKRLTDLGLPAQQALDQYKAALGQ